MTDEKGGTTGWTWRDAWIRAKLVVAQEVIILAVCVFVAVVLAILTETFFVVPLAILFYGSRVLVWAVQVRTKYSGAMPFERETRCRQCGYILRGISEPRCPECGERI